MLGIESFARAVLTLMFRQPHSKMHPAAPGIQTFSPGRTLRRQSAAGLMRFGNALSEQCSVDWRLGIGGQELAVRLGRVDREWRTWN